LALQNGNAGRTPRKSSHYTKVNFKGWEEHEQHKSVVLGSRGTLKGTGGAQAGPMGKMSFEAGKLTGTSWFDPELGALIETVADQTMRLKGELPGAPGGDKGGGMGFTSDIGQKVTLKLVEVGKVQK